ncbi:MAG TPA: hypothetical protein VH682_09095, partial [Gemmataceae bacterium]
MDRQQDNLARVCQVSQQIHYQNGILGRQARGRFVQKQEERVGQQFHRQVDALALPTADPLALGRADQDVGRVPQPELVEYLINPLLDA